MIPQNVDEFWMKNIMSTTDELRRNEEYYGHNIGRFNYRLLEWVGKFMQKRPTKLFMEIGVWRGDTTAVLLQYLQNPDDRIVTIDKSPKQYFYDRFNLNKIDDKKYSDSQEKILLYKGASFDVLSSLINKYKSRFDFILIDASHNASNVLEDIILSFHLLKYGGVMYIDDVGAEESDIDPSVYGFNGPFYVHMKEAVNAFMKCYQNQYKILVNNYQVGIIKVVENNDGTILYNDAIFDRGVLLESVQKCFPTYKS